MRLFAEARSEFTGAIELKTGPRRVQAFVGLACCCVVEGDLPNAADQLKQALQEILVPEWMMTDYMPTLAVVAANYVASYFVAPISAKVTSAADDYVTRLSESGQWQLKQQREIALFLNDVSWQPQLV